MSLVMVARVGGQEYRFNPEYDVGFTIVEVVKATQARMLSQSYKPLYSAFHTPPTDDELATALRAYIKFYTALSLSREPLRGYQLQLEASRASGLLDQPPAAMLAVTFYLGTLFFSFAARAAHTTLQEVGDREGAVREMWLGARYHAHFASLPRWKQRLCRRFRIFHRLWGPPPVDQDKLSEEINAMWPVESTPAEAEASAEA